MMTSLIRTHSNHPDFIHLVKCLDLDLAIRDGNDHSFYAQFNKIGNIQHVVVLYQKDNPIGCGALKKYNATTMEIKRMYTLPEYRGAGIATQILIELETWARELSFEKCILETGKKQPEAIALYRKKGYQIIANYGQYAAIENSVCFEKEIM